MTPFIIGICGGTGSGKTTLARNIALAVGGDALLLSMDSYYKTFPDLTYEERTLLNYDHPDIMDTDLLLAHLRALKAGGRADVPVYDFSVHLRRDEVTHAESRPVIILEGILLFCDPRIVEQLDMKIYVDTDADTRLIRRLRRDMTERARSMKSVLSQYENTVKPMHDLFVEPSKREADIIVPGGKDNTIAFDMILSAVMQRMGRKGVRAEQPEENKP